MCIDRNMLQITFRTCFFGSCSCTGMYALSKRGYQNQKHKTKEANFFVRGWPVQLSWNKENFALTQLDHSYIMRTINLDIKRNTNSAMFLLTLS